MFTEECACCAKEIICASEDERQAAYNAGNSSEAFCAECLANGCDE